MSTPLTPPAPLRSFFRHFDWLSTLKSKTASSTTLHRRNYTLASFPEELSSKIYLLKHFQGFMDERLLKDKPYCFTDLGRTKGLEFVQKYLRMKHVIVFKLSHEVLQVSTGAFLSVSLPPTW